MQRQPITMQHPPPRLSLHLASEMPPPLSAPTNQNSEPAFRPRRSPRLNPELDRVCAIKSPPRALALQSQKSIKMAWTYPLSLGYSQCLGAKVEPLSFASVCLEDLRNGDLEYLSTIEQLIDALPKTEDPASHFELLEHITPPGHQRLCHSMRAALWWLLPSDGEFRRASHSLHAEHASRQDHSEIWELYKLAQIDPRQDLTATRTRDNISGFGLSSPALQQPPTKPFSGLPSRPKLTSPYREAREAGRERPGIVYPLLPRSAHRDMRLQVDAALPEATAFDRGTHGVGHCGLQPDRGRTPARNLAATQTTLTPFPQATQESFYGSV